MASCSLDETVQIWDLATGAPLLHIATVPLYMLRIYSYVFIFLVGITGADGRVPSEGV